MKHWTAAASYRKATEDRARVWELPDGELVVAVADGAGGIGGGGRAAELVVEGLSVAMEGSSDVNWVHVLGDLDPQIEADHNAGESTAIVLQIEPDGSLEGASCGDSTAWFVTDDGYLNDLTQNQHRKRRVGSGRALPVTFAREGAPGWIVVASDGLFGTAPNEKLVEALLESQTEDPAAALVEATRTPRGTWLDDVAVVVVRLGG